MIDADIDRALAGGEPRFPNGSHFIPADLATPEAVRDAQARGGTVVIVDADESVRVLPPLVSR